MIFLSEGQKKHPRPPRLFPYIIPCRVQAHYDTMNFGEDKQKQQVEEEEGEYKYMNVMTT